MSAMTAALSEVPYYDRAAHSHGMTMHCTVNIITLKSKWIYVIQLIQLHGE